MATSLVVNAVSYLYPDTGDQSWGAVASAWAAAVTTGMLQKAGGAFTLTADANFGPNFGLLSKYVTSQSANAATTGIFRLANTESVSWRNNANGADIALSKNASDQLTWAGTAFLSSAGVLLAGGFPALTGDVTTNAGSLTTTVAAIGGVAVGTPTGTGNVVFSNSPTLVTPALGTPSALVGTNITGTAAGLTAGHVTTNANSTGDVTSVGNATTVAAIQTKTVSGTTGTGNVVFSASPTLTGTITAAGLTLSSALTVANGGTGIASGNSGGVPYFSGSTSIASSAALTASQLIVGGGAGAAPATLAAGSQYQVLVMGASNPGYGQVNLAQAAAVTGVLPNGNTTAVSAATASTIVSRDANSNTTVNNLIENYATTATAAGTTTLTVSSSYNQYFTGSTTQTVVLPDATTLTLGQSFFIVNLSSGIVTVNKNGGTLVQSMAANSFVTVTVTNIGSAAGSWNPSYAVNNAGGGTVTSVTFTGDGTVLSSTPSSAVTTTGTVTAALKTQTARTFLQGPSSGSAATPTFAALTAPTVQKFTATGSTTGYLFTVTSANATVGATYTNNGNTYTVLGTISAGTQLFCSQASAPTSSGTLTKASGTGDATITFSANVALGTYTTPTSPAPLYIKIKMVGAGAGAGGGGASAGDATVSGGLSAFGPNILIANGGAPGKAGSTEAAGALGGTTSVAAPAVSVISVSGGDGGAGNTAATSSNGFPTGLGGSSFFGGAGGPGGVVSAGAAGGANGKANSGSGGGGGSNAAAGAPSGGGGGAGGYIEAWITSSIAATYPYIVGAGSSGGAAGTSGGAGGNGAAGIVIVEEYYQ